MKQLHISTNKKGNSNMAAPMRRNDHYNLTSQQAQRAGLLSVLLASPGRAAGYCTPSLLLPTSITPYHLLLSGSLTNPTNRCRPGSYPHEPDWLVSYDFKYIGTTNRKAISWKHEPVQPNRSLKPVFLFLLFTFYFLLPTQAQLKKWQTGIETNEFIFDTASFPESHAATIAETPKGLIAAWFGGTKEGNKDVCIWTSHLQNGKWTPPQKAADGILNDTLRYACYNPVLFQQPGGKLFLFYKIGPNVAGWTGWLKTSTDNGHTWSDRTALPEGYLGPIKNKPVLLKDGTLLCPSSTEKNGWKVHFETTKDWGKTWQYIGPINDGKTYNAIQPSVLTYPNGRMQILCRSRETELLQSWSEDGGNTWSAISPTSLPNNNSGTDAVTLKDGRQLLVYNHRQPDSTWVKGKGPRTPLNVAVTKDGKTWYAAAILEDSPISQYSYPSVIQSKDGMVHIVYTWRRKRIKYVKLNPAKLKLIEIKNGEWPTMMGYKAPVAGEVTDN